MQPMAPPSINQAASKRLHGIGQSQGDWDRSQRRRSLNHHLGMLSRGRDERSQLQSQHVCKSELEKKGKMETVKQGKTGKERVQR
jgi:hypothetical protein